MRLFFLTPLLVGQRWTAHARADGSRIEFRYDCAGLKVATIDPLGRETLIERDDDGQVIGQTGSDGTRWAIRWKLRGQQAPPPSPMTIPTYLTTSAPGSL